MSTISVVVPTLTGREGLLDQAKRAYSEHSPGHSIEWVVVRNRRTCGEGWAEGVRHATGDWLHLAADDILPHPGWADAAIEAAEQGFYPSPRLLTPQGGVEACGSMGSGLLLDDCPDWTPCVSSPFAFIRRDLLPPDVILPIHYSCDDHLSHLARCAGLRVVVRRPYCFTHLEGLIGRDEVVARVHADRAEFLAAVCR